MTLTGRVGRRMTKFGPKVNAHQMNAWPCGLGERRTFGLPCDEHQVGFHTFVNRYLTKPVHMLCVEPIVRTPCTVPDSPD